MLFLLHLIFNLIFSEGQIPSGTTVSVSESVSQK